MTNTSSLGQTHNTFAIHDTFRNGLLSVKADSTAPHPLAVEPEKYSYSRLRNTFGLAEPLRQMMDRALLSQVRGIPVKRNIGTFGLQVYDGGFDGIEFEDYLGKGFEGDFIDVHGAMEKKLNL